MRVHDAPARGVQVGRPAGRMRRVVHRVKTRLAGVGFDKGRAARYIGSVLFLRHCLLLLVGCAVWIGADARALSSMPQTYTIYGLIDPRTSEIYYVGQTGRKLIERTDEHFFEAADTLVAKRNRAILKLGLVPGILKLDEAADARAAFHAELYWIHALTLRGTRLLNREAQPWFYERYAALFGPRAEAVRPMEDTPPLPLGARHGEAWTEEEDSVLLGKFKAGASVAEIAGQHRRSVKAIEKRLAKLQEDGQRYARRP